MLRATRCRGGWGGEVGADGAECLGSGEGAHAAGTLMRSLLILITRSASLLSKGTRSSPA